MDTLNDVESKQRRFIPMKKICLIFSITLVGYLLLGIAPAARGFIAFVHFEGVQFNVLLIHRIDKEQWTIGYRYGAECLPEDRQNGKALEEAITASLRAWLQPLRELHPARPITDDFRYVLQPDFNGDNPDNFAGLIAVDTRITFECRQSRSVALVGGGTPPDIFIREGTRITPPLVGAVSHELGHAFGLADTYVRAYKGRLASTGGSDLTVGTQPMSVMAALSSEPPEIREDDKNGILWLYKHLYENLDLEDCFFPDYVFEESPRGCIPKHPFIFEVKHTRSWNHITYQFVMWMLDEDPQLDVNAQDEEGFTALHYAVMYEREGVVERLLARKNIKPFLRDKRGRSALALAREANLRRLIVLLLKHPLTLPVHPAGSLTTTWGSLKRR